MRQPKSCQQCHARHKRCVTRKGTSKCSECEETGVDCLPRTRLQFIFSHDQPTISRRRTRQARGNKKSSSRQARVEVPSSPGDPSTTQPIVNGNPASPIALSPIPPLDSPFTLQIDSFSPHVDKDIAGSIQGEDPEAISSPESLSVPVPHAPSEDSYGTTSPLSFASTRSSGFLTISAYDPKTSKDSDVYSPQNLNDLSSPSAPSRNLPQLSNREALLMRIYVQRITLSCDGCDNERHFATAVPKLAFTDPMVLYGILALSSRYEELRTENTDDFESTYYHNKCLELLIEALSGPSETYGVSLLAAVVLSRLYEEYKVEQDTHFHHLSGTKNLLTYNAITRSAQKGGLAEAACWVHLHQAIYVSLVHSRKPRDIDLDIFETFNSFKESSDCHVVNRSVYLLAKVIQVFFSTTIDAQQKDSTMGGLGGELDEWWMLRPSSVYPLREDPVDAEADRPFPSIWMLSSVQVMALEYYYASRIMLCLHWCERSAAQTPSLFEGARLRRENERTILGYLHHLIGLARGNDYFPGAGYMPSYMLSLCGYLIKDPTERAHIVQLLNDMQKQIVFRATSGIVQALSQQWEELDSIRQL